MIRFSVRVSVCAMALAVLAAGCGREQSNEPSVATATVTLNHDRAPGGSPLDITYKFEVASDAKFDENYRVFAHVVDADEEQMWNDDHDPPVPTTQWKPGQTVEYTRTIFVPVFPYVGDATFEVGLHSVKDQHRLTLNGEDAGQKSYKTARMQLLPPSANLFMVFKDGWNPVEGGQQDPALEWRWTKKQATLAFKNPKKDAIFFFDVDSPAKELHGPQQVQLVLGGQTVQTLTVNPEERILHRITLPGSLMGDAELTELQIIVDHSFVPMIVTNGTSTDPRELGVRVFHAYVDPR